MLDAERDRIHEQCARFEAALRRLDAIIQLANTLWVPKTRPDP